MTYEVLTATPKTGVLVGRAMRRNRTMSVDGILERMFAFAFRGLVYPQIWEDPVVDIAAMEVQPHHHIVTIASGGCNVLSYLTSEPKQITAVDLNSAHVALTRLKLTALQILPSWQDYYQFFGDANAPENKELFLQKLKPALDPETLKYWTSRSWAGQKRFRNFQKNHYRSGLLGHFIGVGHLLAKLYGRNLSTVLDCRSIEQQKQYFDTEIAPLLQRPFIKWLTDRRVSLYGLGIPPAQYEALANGRPMRDVLHERLERLTCGFPLGSNYFTWQAFGRSYAPGASGPVPLYLEKVNYAKLRSQAAKVSVCHVSLTDALNAMPASSADRFVLLDAQDWMTDDQLNALWSAITHAASPSARVIFRTAGVETILPGRVMPATLNQWHYLKARSLELAQQDRSSIYGGFHIYERTL